MNDDDRKTSSPDDPLDDWLAQARWAEPTAASTERLRSHSRELSGSPRSRWRTRESLVALAATIVVAFGVWVVMSKRANVRTPAVSINPTGQIAMGAPAPLPGREMTPLERTLVEAQIRKEELRKKKATTTVAERTVVASVPKKSGSSLRSDTGVPQAVASAPTAPAFAARPFLERVANTETRQSALAELDSVKSPPVDQLMQFLSDSRADLRIAAALSLGRIDGPTTTRRLIDLVERNQSRREAFLALASSRGREAQQYVRGAAASDQYAGIARSAIIESQSQLQ